MNDKALLDNLKEIISGIFVEHNIELVDIAFKKEGGKKVLKILADADGGITLDKCTEMSYLIGEALDKRDIIMENYVLEVSSPGLDRPLKKPADYSRVIGKNICVYTYVPINEKKEFKGILESVDKDSITVLEEGLYSVTIPVDKISKATLDYKSLI
ncbi:MAG: ribosome maturation factor RimP [Candidatus Omnitrophica bacterium]|nr:ribosome maturation factor RimP [Candidatus Omnitrophota bacterium]